MEAAYQQVNAFNIRFQMQKWIIGYYGNLY